MNSCSLLFVLLAAPVVLSSLSAASFAQEGTIRATALRCEYLRDPFAVQSPQPRLSWMVEATGSAARGRVQTAYQILVADCPDVLARDEGNLWDSGRVASDESIHIVYAGSPLSSRAPAFWKVRVWDNEGRASAWCAPARWTMGLLEPADWTAQWIGDEVPPEADPIKPDALPATMLRKTFQLTSAPIKSATAYVTALGLYELHINGSRVGDHVLAPEWTDYRKRVQYQGYDVTALLRDGENAIGAILGDGWYAGRIGLAFIVPNGPIRAIYGRQTKLLVQLEITCADGGRRRIVSDDSWRCTRDGPIRAGDILDGETYDAGREMPGWDQPGFDDSTWRAATAFGRSAIERIAQPNEPMRVTQEISPVARTEPRPGVFVYDLGQNFAGWCRLNVRGPAGTTLSLRHGEVLNPDGTIYTANLRSAGQTDRYTLHGGGEAVFEPRFTYHGFRYVEISGVTPDVTIASLTGRVMNSSVPPAGSFECSDRLLNRLMQNIVWTQRANMPGIPTDCPQRDERLGWMGDILAFAQTACFNMDMAAFCTKFAVDMRDAQARDGRYPDFAPHPFDPDARFSGVPAWGDAGVFVPWVAYVNYGDRRLLEVHFDSMKRWIDWIAAKNPDQLWKNGRNNDYGDWLNADTLKLEGWPGTGAEVPKEVFATMFFARSAWLVAQIAHVLGREDDARKYSALFEDIRAAFNRAYVKSDGNIAGNTQAGCALALSFDLLPEDLREAAAARMLAAFDRYDGCISTGFHSTICLMNELTRRGHEDAAYRLLLNRRMPSWLYPIEHGATTIGERWDGFVESRGFQDPGMNSFSHYALGSVGEWMWRTIVGINPCEQALASNRPAETPESSGCSPACVAYRHVIIRPRPGGGLTWARGVYNSIRGALACEWGLADGLLTVDVDVPANVRATVYIPTHDAAGVRESGQPIRALLADRAAGAAHPDVERIQAKPDVAVFRVGSGRYVFTAVP
jgi:alpha-L-rhamnosidase